VEIKIQKGKSFRIVDLVLSKMSETLASKWKKLPKIDLHRHLEGSIRYSTVKELSTDLAGLSDAEAYEKSIITSPSCGLAKVFETFWIAQRILSTAEVIERVTFEACEDAANDGVAILELRYQPSFVQIDHPHLSFTEIHKAVLAGVNRAETAFPTLCVGLIGIIGRNLTIEIAKETTDFIIENKDTFIGADLANVEIGNSPVPFAEYFQRIKQAGLGVTSML
jgi:adenosine deaminase